MGLVAKLEPCDQNRVRRPVAAVVVVVIVVVIEGSHVRNCDYDYDNKHEHDPEAARDGLRLRNLDAAVLVPQTLGDNLIDIIGQPFDLKDVLQLPAHQLLATFVVAPPAGHGVEKP